MSDRDLIYRVHAIQRMFERGITAERVRRVVDEGEMIQTYPEDTPYPSRLILYIDEQGPLHVVAADIPDQSRTVIITVYEPAPSAWSADFKTRINR